MPMVVVMMIINEIMATVFHPKRRKRGKNIPLLESDKTPNSNYKNSINTLQNNPQEANLPLLFRFPGTTIL